MNLDFIEMLSALHDAAVEYSGVTLDEGWASRITVPIGSLDVPVIRRECLIRSKRAAVLCDRGPPTPILRNDNLQVTVAEPIHVGGHTDHD